MILRGLLLVLAANAWAASLPPEAEERLNAKVREEHRPLWEQMFPPRKPKVENPKKVVARKGPVEITLEVANTTVRSHRIVNMRHHSLWLRVTLRNIGKKPFQVWDGAFQFLLDLEDSVGLHYEIVGEDGSRIERDRLGGSELDRPAVCPKPPSDPDWYKYKVPFALAPGKSVSTPESWMSHVVEIACLGRSERSPLPPYGEVLALAFGENKKAKIRLVYDWFIPKKLRSDPDEPSQPENVTFATDWIPLVIAP
ncbi:MAG: hypothetical protein FD129_89 [bacterium]|nr:MAG: hypothetical protein FD129_89 [bacterium]